MQTVIGTARGLKGLPGSDALDGREVTALAAAERVLWALLDEQTVWRFDSQWQKVANLAGAPGTCILPLPDGVLCGTREARLVRIGEGRPEWVEGFDAVEGRDKWFTPWGGPPDTRSMARSSDGTIYVSVHVGGILRSTDGGHGWEPCGLDIGMDVHQVVVHPEQPSTVLAACAFGLAVSRDAGESWTLLDDGLTGAYSRAVAIAGPYVLLTASNGPGGSGAALYRKRFDADGPFEAVAGLPSFNDNLDTHWLDARDGYAALLAPNGDVYVSEDDGTTWTQHSQATGNPRCLVVVE